MRGSCEDELRICLVEQGAHRSFAHRQRQKLGRAAAAHHRRHDLVARLLVHDALHVAVKQAQDRFEHGLGTAGKDDLLGFAGDAACLLQIARQNGLQAIGAAVARVACKLLIRCIAHDLVGKLHPDPARKATRLQVAVREVIAQLLAGKDLLVKGARLKRVQNMAHLGAGIGRFLAKEANVDPVYHIAAPGDVLNIALHRKLQIRALDSSVRHAQRLRELADGRQPVSLYERSAQDMRFHAVVNLLVQRDVVSVVDIDKQVRLSRCHPVPSKS